MTLGTFFTALGYLVGIAVFFGAARERRLATEGIVRIALAGWCGGIIGAKVTEWMLVHWPVFTSNPAAMFDPGLGGRSLIGGILAGWITVEAAKSKLGIRRSTGDLFALALPAGEAVGRVGCFFNACCYGTPSTVAWAVHQHAAWRHPAQLYSATAAAVIFVMLLAHRNHQRREGDLFRGYLLLSGIARFGLEFVRQRTLAWGGLSLAQWVSLEVALTAAILLMISHHLPHSAATAAT